MSPERVISFRPRTVLDLDQESEALQLAREIVAGLESGALEPTAGALEPLVDVLR